MLLTGGVANQMPGELAGGYYIKPTVFGYSKMRIFREEIRETHKMMLDHYQQTKNVLVSYGTKALGFF